MPKTPGTAVWSEGWESHMPSELLGRLAVRGVALQICSLNAKFSSALSIRLGEGETIVSLLTLGKT